MNNLQKNTASFRDPRGSVFHLENRILRSITPMAADDFNYVRGTGLINKLIAAAKLLPEQKIDKEILGVDPEVSYVLEHPKLAFVSYPYEWPFAALQQAALLQLDILHEALSSNVMLTDASAYNIQFQGAQPVFIDHLAFRRYQNGEIWPGHRQFCQQFLNPLLLQSYVGLPFNQTYRGSVTGIAPAELKKLLPRFYKFLPKVFMHVVLQSSLQKTTAGDAVKVLPKINLPLSSLQKMIRGLQNWIKTLSPHPSLESEWKNYSKEYQTPAAKTEMVKEFINTIQPDLIYDLGCNDGQYAKISLQAGAKQVIGFDADPVVVNQAYHKAQTDQLNFLPLVMDLVNPSPAQGWNSMEQQSFLQRAKPDGLLALALVHHLAIAKNIPLPQLTDWLLSIAPQGLVEFVPKTDAMTQELLCMREDIFADYTLENFLTLLKKQTKIVKSRQVPDTDRTLIWYKKC